MKKYYLFFFVGTIVLMNCSIFKKSANSSNGTPSVSSSENRPAESKSEEGGYHSLNQEEQLAAVANLTDQQYSNGMSIYEAKCGTCHDLPFPDSQDVGGWLRIMKSMSEKAKLSNEEEKQVMGYLYTNCRK